MNFEHSFTLPLPIDRAWPLLLDLERIAPCVPGAQLQEVDGAEHRGLVKVKLGPITAQYKGAVVVEEADAATRRIVLNARARDVHGQGAANAKVVAVMSPEGEGVRVTLATDLQISGKVAQLGKGVMNDVAGKLIQQFADALARDLGETAPAAPPATPAAATGPAPAASAARRIDAPEPEALDLLAVSGSALAKRIGLAAAVLLLVGGGLYLLGRTERAGGRANPSR